MLLVEDKKGRVPHPNWLLNGFREVVNDCNLIDLPLEGYQFTWARSLDSVNAVEERLDRGMVTEAWLNLFPNARLKNLIAPISDHSPIILCLEEAVQYNCRRRFRFENGWLREPSLVDIVNNSWENAHDGDILMKLQHCSKEMEQLSKSLNFNFRKAIIDCKNSMEEARLWDDEQGVAGYLSQKEKMISLLLQEEDYWRQRAKAFWLKDGDSNTRYFHIAASARKRANYIKKLMNVEGVVVSRQDELCEVARGYFQELFQAQHSFYGSVIDAVQPVICEEQNQILMRPFMENEFKEAIFQMHPDKSPGPDS